jgi:hypothetical protein
MKKDLYVVTKLIFATSAQEAIEKEKNSKVNEVWIEGDWKKDKIDNIITGHSDIGFQHGGSKK